MNELLIQEVEGVVFEPPDLFFTVNDWEHPNPRSVAVVEHLNKMSANTNGYRGQVYNTVDEALKVAQPGAVAIFDADVGRNEFKPGLTNRAGAPEWANGTLWCVRVGPKCSDRTTRQERCARQSIGTFRKRFTIEIERQWYPWGTPKRGDEGPKEIIRLDSAVIEQRLATLNSGPDLAAAIADTKHSLELPKGSRISWVHVSPEPIGYSRETMETVTSAMRCFEQSCQKLVTANTGFHEVILSGVNILDERLREVYLNPGVDCFTVARPDLHWGITGLKASEDDEMPGGLPELVLLDQAYGINQDSWDRFFSFLTKDGPVAFVVSHQWSRCYIPETTWLVNHMVELGFDARLVTTDRLDVLEITPTGIFHMGARLGCIWRQFPIFETSGKLADLVLASRNGQVKMYPEWGHFGNKAWFHLFWRYQNLFSQHLSDDDFRTLQNVLPRSHLVLNRNSFPLNVGDFSIADANELANLSEHRRNELVLKITGANNMAARSYGVLMGHGISSIDWSNWVNARVAAKEPFLVQRMFQTGIASLPVWHTKDRQSKMFRCRLLMRPWVLNGKIIAVHGCAVPRTCFKVHGMVSMAIAPIQLL